MSVTASNISGNAVGLFGGGLFLGGASYSGVSSCTLSTLGCHFDGNVAMRGGAQLYRFGDWQ